MRRRDVLVSLGGISLFSPATAQTRGTPVVGVLWHAADEVEEAPFLKPFLHGLAEHGYVDGRNIRLVYRFAGENYGRFPSQAKELIDGGAQIIIGSIPPAVFAARGLTSTIPIVTVTSGDPIGSGLAQSLARPGGNVTGLSTMALALSGKQVELLGEAAPSIRSLAFLHNPASALLDAAIQDARNAAAAARLDMHVVRATRAEELSSALKGAAEQGAAALLIPGDGLFWAERRQIVATSLALKMAPVSVFKEMVELGSLFSYGADIPDLFRRAAGFVDRLLRGANAAELPIEQPTKFNLAVNNRTARLLGFDIPSTMLVSASEVLD